MEKKWWHGYVRIGRWAVLIGFIAGVWRALEAVGANRYLPQELYRVALGTAVISFNSTMFAVIFGALALAVVYHTYHRITRNSWRALILMGAAALLIMIGGRIADAGLRGAGALYGAGSLAHLAATAYYSLREGGAFVLMVNLAILWVALAVLGLVLNLVLFPLRRLRDAELRAPGLVDRIASVFIGRPALAAMLVFFVAVNGWSARVDRGRRPVSELNLVLISIDTLRADHVGAYCDSLDLAAVKAQAPSPAAYIVCDGYAHPVTPNIDEFAAQGVLFEQAYAPSPWTLPSHATMFTSLNPSVHRADTYESFLPDHITTVAERLWDRGYSTGAVASHIFLSAMYGLDQGFRSMRYLPDGKADWVTDNAIEFVRANSNRPFFLFAHYFDPHTDYAPPEEYARKFTDPTYPGPVTGKEGHFQRTVASEEDLRHVLGLYAGEVNFVDDQLGRLFQVLDELGLSENTLVIITSDHGEEFLDRGGWGHATLYDEIMRVPMIMRLPGRLPAGLRVPTQVRLTDIPPTLLDMARIPPDPLADGESLIPLAFADQNPAQPRLAMHRPAFGEKNAAVEDNQHRYMLRYPPYKYFYYERDRDLLFLTEDADGLGADPFERRKSNLIDSDDLELRQVQVDFQGMLLDHINNSRTKGDAIHQRRPSNIRRLDQATIDQLEALGYITGGRER